MTKYIKIIFIILIILLFAACAGAIFFIGKKLAQNKINSFTACAKAGYPIMESYPRQCRVPGGDNFVEELTPEEKNKLIPPLENCKNVCGDRVCQEIVCEAIGCPCSETKESCPRDCANQAGSGTGLANPASVNCERLGGKVEIRTDKQGGQIGYCLFSNSQECEEWALFRNECSLSPSSQMGVLEGKVEVGPICPVARPGQPCPVPPAAYTSREVIIYKSDGLTEIARQNFTGQGAYKFNLPPGVYIVNTSQNGIDSSKDLPQTVIIKSGETLTLDFSIDTGIR